MRLLQRLALVLLFLGLPAATEASSVPPHPASELASLERVLAPDGTLNPGTFEGALDVQGWRMETVSDGRPRFVRDDVQPQAALGGDENWDPRFWNNGVSGTVYSSVVSGTNIFVGGSFSTAGNVRANNIARYDTTTGTWHAVGYGLNASVSALHINNGLLYIGGGFTTVCGDASCTTTLQQATGVNRIATWNGSTFSPLGFGVDSTVLSITSGVAGPVYFGGAFNWRCIDLTCSSSQLAVDANRLNRIASWNGSAFSSLNFGLNFMVRSMDVGAGVLYLGGDFSAECDNAQCSTSTKTGVNLVATWNGSAFGSLANGLAGGIVHTIYYSSGGADYAFPQLFIGGSFNRSCSVTDCTTQNAANGMNRIVRWNTNNATFFALGNGVSNSVNTVRHAPVQGRVYLGGSFISICTNADCSTTDGSLGTRYLAFWNVSASSYNPLGFGVDNVVDDILFNNSLGGAFIGGSFQRICTNVGCSTSETLGANRYVRWNSTYTRFPEAANTVNEEVSVLAVMNGDIYLGGSFNRAGPVTANNVARYSPSTNTWSSLGFGLEGSVYAFAVNGSTLYVGGTFQGTCADVNCAAIAPASGLNRVAAWNGTSFTPLANGVDSEVYALVVSNGTLYLGGRFQQACADVSCGTLAPFAGLNRIAAWNGTAFTPLAKGLDYYVYTLIPSPYGLILGGEFQNSCQNDNCSAENNNEGLNYVASWNGSAFVPLGYGLDSTVRSAVVDGSKVYLGGAFTRLCLDAPCYNTSTTRFNALVAWNGSTYEALGDGLRSEVYTVAIANGKLFAGGDMQGTCTSNACSAYNESLTALVAWDGTSYSSLGSGLQKFDDVMALLTVNGDLYVGGRFEGAGPFGTTHFGRYGEKVDLAVSVTPNAPVVGPGAAISYTALFTNVSGATAMNTQATITLPGNATLVSTTPTNAICTGSGPITCSAGFVAPGQSFSVTIAMTAGTPGQATLQTTVTSSQVETVNGNNSASASILIASADLSVSIAPVTGASMSGPFFATILVTNLGPSSSIPTLVFDLQSVTIVSLSSSSGSCTTTCTLALLDPAASATVTVRLAPVAIGPAGLHVTASGSVPDTVSTNNKATVDFVVGPAIIAAGAVAHGVSLVG